MSKTRTRTEDLDFIPATADIIGADLISRNKLGKILAAQVPDEWPSSYYKRAATKALLRQLAARPGLGRWSVWYVIADVGRQRTLIGLGAFSGPPDRNGTIEIGYCILSAWQNRSFGTQTVAGLVDIAFSDVRVDMIIAKVAPETMASIRILIKNGFIVMTEHDNNGLIHFSLSRADYLARR